MSEKNKSWLDMSLQEKRTILEYYDKLPKMSQRNAAMYLNISQPFLSKILKNRSTIENSEISNQNKNRKRKRHGKDNQMESALKIFINKIREKNYTMCPKSEELTKTMDKENFVSTEGGWFNRLKGPENIEFKHKYNSFEDRETQTSRSILDSDVDIDVNADNNSIQGQAMETMQSKNLYLNTLNYEENSCEIPGKIYTCESTLHTCQRNHYRQQDRFDFIGKTFSMKLRSLPREQMLIAEKLMNETLFQAEIGCLTLSHRLVNEEIPQQYPYTFDQYLPSQNNSGHFQDDIETTSQYSNDMVDVPSLNLSL